MCKIESHIQSILQEIGDNPNRPGLQDTPQKVAKAMQTMFRGYAKKIDFSTTTNGAENGQIITLEQIPFVSYCEHHMLPFSGKCIIKYTVNEKIANFGRFTELVDTLSSRLQTQENLTSQIANELYARLEPINVEVKMVAKHFCMQISQPKNIKVTTTTILPRQT